MQKNQFYREDYTDQENSIQFSDKQSLDFLLEQDLPSIRKTRSSFDNNERDFDIPICRPQRVSRRDQNNRGEIILESRIPDFSPCRHPSLRKDRFMNIDTFDEDVDFLFPQRDVDLFADKNDIGINHGCFMDEDNFDEDVDFLFGRRDRGTSMTVMSSNEDYQNSSQSNLTSLRFSQQQSLSVDTASISDRNQSMVRFANVNRPCEEMCNIQDTSSLLEGLRLNENECIK